MAGTDEIKTKEGKGEMIMNEKKYYIYFLGGSNSGKIIKADSMKTAKWIFAKENDINSINRIAAKKFKEA